MVEYEQRERVAVLTINRPEARNAVNGDVAKGIEAADRPARGRRRRLGRHPHRRRARSSAPAPTSRRSPPARPADLQTKRGGFAGLVQRERTKPIIAAVDGPALAGGTEIVLACDLVVASHATRRSASPR